MTRRLDLLPDEILHSIILSCDPKDAAAVSQASRRLNTVVESPLLWRKYCQQLFSFWDEQHEIERKFNEPISSVDWKGLYVRRHLLDQATTRIINQILAHQSGRIRRIESIVKNGYDVKDTLIRHNSVGVDKEDYLARRYWSSYIIGCLRRDMAVREWTKLRNGEPVSIARAIAAFDLFIPESPVESLSDVPRCLDNVAAQFLEQHPEISSLTFREKAALVASYLLSNNLTGIQPDKAYHSLEHNFIGIALLKDPHHSSLPLISAVIYCHVAQFAGLDAVLCGFPFHVHVIIKPATKSGADIQTLYASTEEPNMYLDPFRSTEEVPLDALRSQLRSFGASAIDQSDFLEALPTSDMVLRSGRNVLYSVQQALQAPRVQSVPVDVVGAKYAGFWSLILFERPLQPLQLREHLYWLLEPLVNDFSPDIHLVERYVLPLFDALDEQQQLRDELHRMRTMDETPKRRQLRSLQTKAIKYLVGEVFRHRRYFYQAVIVGWDPQCEAGEHWIRQMGVDNLRDGRSQSFYHVLVEDGSLRYVAEENIERILPELAELPSALLKVAGKYFRRFDDEARKFVSNLGEEFPED